MSAGPSSSRNHDTEQQSLNDLSSVFPQIDTGVLRAVLHQEGSYEAAVEALLISVVSCCQPGNASFCYEFRAQMHSVLILFVVKLLPIDSLNAGGKQQSANPK